MFLSIIQNILKHFKIIKNIKIKQENVQLIRTTLK